MVTMDDLHEEMRGGSYWRAEAKRYEALWRSALLKGSVANDSIKGDVEWSFDWGDGLSGTFTAHSDEAEAAVAKSAQFVVLHALSKGEARLVLGARRVGEAKSSGELREGFRAAMAGGDEKP